MSTRWANDHVAFEVADLDSAIQFYAGVFGMELMSKEVDPEHGEAFAFFALDGGNLELLQRLDPDGAGPHGRGAPGPPWCPHLALRTDDLDAALRMLLAHNVPIVNGPLEIPGKVRWLYAADPDGNIIEFVQWT
ncbi:MAG: VOC family protein [Candidatus Hydrogenedentes bacterium]|nr:VOC family protein [Candidatus Hydrogenedentota bacterium]